MIMKKLLVLGIITALALSGCTGEKANEIGNEMDSKVVVIDKTSKETESKNIESKNIESKEQVNADLDDSSGSGLAPYVYTFELNRFETTDIPDFLEEDLKDLFGKALEFEMDWSISLAVFDVDDFVRDSGSYTVEKDGGLYHRTGYSYESFYEFLSTMFTKRRVDEMLSTDAIINEDGEVCYADVGRGGAITYKDGYFELISKTENEVKFKYIGHYSFEGIMTEEELREINDGPYSWDEEFIFSIVKTDDGWRVDEINLWF
jgi:hypothetical protein